MKEFLKSFFVRTIAVVALVLIGVMIYSASTGGLASLPQTFMGAVVTPIQSFVTGISDAVSDFFSGMFSGGDLQEQVDALLAENAELRKKMVDYDELKQQNDWYNEILGLHEEHSDYTFASGRVIGRDPSDAYGNFTISVGKNADVSVNDPVVTTDGDLVGVVYEVGLTYSKVRTILDPATKVAAQISRTGDTGYTAGSTVDLARQQTVRLTTLERSSGVAVGDYLITSGIGGIFPDGLLIGTVREINSASDGMTLDANVELMADINNLKQVMIICSFDGQGAALE
ncbi:MAG: rod shape-determining protein MreC [Clostridia bacterium]|nr:rod shape-determining protein MreC [Clostridia bacterium]